MATLHHMYCPPITHIQPVVWYMFDSDNVLKIAGKLTVAVLLLLT
jgi:hypothetical protein